MHLLLVLRRLEARYFFMNQTASVLPTQLLSIEQGLTLDGELVFSTLSDISKESKTMIKNHENNSLLIDCTKLDRVDSAGIALMVEWKRWCKEINKPCRIVGIQPQVSALIDTYKLNKVLIES